MHSVCALAMLTFCGQSGQGEVELFEVEGKLKLV